MHVCACMCVCCMCMCVHMCFGACVCMHAYVCTCICAQECMCVPVCVYMCVLHVVGCLYMCINVQRTAPSHLSVRSHTCFLHRVSPWPKAQPGFCYLHVPSTEITSIHHEIPRRYQFHGDALLLEVKLRSSCLQGKHLTKPLPYRLILTSDGNSQLSVQIA